jgi:hypothetical protein
MRDLEIHIADLRAEAAALRLHADMLADQELAQIMRDAADEVDGAANDAERSVDYVAWIAAGAPL